MKKSFLKKRQHHFSPIFLNGRFALKLRARTFAFPPSRFCIVWPAHDDPPKIKDIYYYYEYCITNHFLCICGFLLWELPQKSPLHSGPRELTTREKRLTLSSSCSGALMKD